MEQAEPTEENLTAIVKWLDEFAWGKNSKDSLKLIKRWSAPKDTLEFLFNPKKAAANAQHDMSEPIMIEASDAISKTALPWLKAVIGQLVSCHHIS